LTAAFGAFLLIILNIASARRINALERDLRDMSLTDPLTQLQNRRGFYLLGEQALLIAKRTHSPLTVLFIDVDGLKIVNDTLGHDMGSQLIVDVGDLLRVSFRTSDVVARIGGDEFAIAVYGPQGDLTPTLKRLDEATTGVNESGKNPYQISYSVGDARTDPEHDESFSELVNRADAVMYQRKRLKKSSRQ
jgi:diguanylate cyclase (GGDEF)-like protein